MQSGGMPSTKSTQRRSALEWRALVEACDRSGLSRRAFAEGEGIQPHTFAWWATRLSPKGPRVRGRSRAAPTAAFVPVQVSSGGTPRAKFSARVGTAEVLEVGPSVEVLLANGRRVRFSLVHASDPRLVALFSAAEGRQ